MLADDPDDVVRLEQTIRHDPGLASQLLRVANSAACSPRTTIDTVQRAIVFLGFSEVRNLALGLSILSIFKSKETFKDSFIEELWTHAIGTGIIAKLLASELGEEETEIFFTAGLLHDLGRMALMACFPQEWKRIVGVAGASNGSLLAAERKVGLPHHVIGAWVARNWGLPGVYVDSIATHHLEPDHPKANMAGTLIQLADNICHHIGMGLFAAPEIDRSLLLGNLGLDAGLIDHLEEQLAEIEGVAQTISNASQV